MDGHRGIRIVVREVGVHFGHSARVMYGHTVLHETRTVPFTFRAAARDLAESWLADHPAEVGIALSRAQGGASVSIGGRPAAIRAWLADAATRVVERDGGSTSYIGEGWVVECSRQVEGWDYSDPMAPRFVGVGR